MKKLFSNRKLLIIGGALALLLFGVGYLVIPFGPKPLSIQFQIGDSTSQPPVQEETTPALPPDPEGPVVPIERSVPRGNGILFPLGERIVNLADPGGYRYLRISITLEFLPESAEFYRLPAEKRKEEETVFLEDVTRQKPVIDDLVISVLVAEPSPTSSRLMAKSN